METYLVFTSVFLDPRSFPACVSFWCRPILLGVCSDVFFPDLISKRRISEHRICKLRIFARRIIWSGKVLDIVKVNVESLNVAYHHEHWKSLHLNRLDFVVWLQYRVWIALLCRLYQCGRHIQTCFKKVNAQLMTAWALFLKGLSRQFELGYKL
jgi:hypothetical protein